MEQKHNSSGSFKPSKYKASPCSSTLQALSPALHAAENPLAEPQAAALQELEPTAIDNLVQHQGNKVRQMSLQLVLVCTTSSAVATNQTKPDQLPSQCSTRRCPDL